MSINKRTDEMRNKFSIALNQINNFDSGNLFMSLLIHSTEVIISISMQYAHANDKTPYSKLQLKLENNK